MKNKRFYFFKYCYILYCDRDLNEQTVFYKIIKNALCLLKLNNGKERYLYKYNFFLVDVIETNRQCDKTNNFDKYFAQ